MTSFIVGKPSSSGKLIVLDGDEQLTSGKGSRQQYPGQNSFREGNGSAKSSIRSLGSRVGSLPSRPGSQGGPPCSSTPTRQVALPKVRRRESREDYYEVDQDEIESVKASISRENSMLDESFNADSGLPSSSSASFMTQRSEEREDRGNSATPGAEAPHTSGESSSKQLKQGSASKQPKQGSSSKQPNEEDSSSDSDEEEKEERKAPTDLFMEFLTCLMSKDYPNALKLCKMILIYEPNHPEALKFLPLIQEKMELDEMPDDPEDGDGNADENEDEEDDDDDSDDSDDDDENESSDEEDSGSDVDEEEFQQIFRREDSGVASATDDP